MLQANRGGMGKEVSKRALCLFKQQRQSAVQRYYVDSECKVEYATQLFWKYVIIPYTYYYCFADSHV